ncbi:hypothetical protein OQ496_08175 [Acetobacter suratthaniensis]|uniref:PilZ domain-containing protein n=1 Tax=Acetobacter suratthaniensis TaxID=1502841 RepID=A0ABS3LLR1_9PROT|nr:hypothetical protein [Acetobacter suratthaniensis]MBO1328309.1 hypothetical protein [Acetobacter suratthaniensis]MCX2566432.1 hypothetical protein [Acetobacter suratthaniensis]
MTGVPSALAEVIVTVEDDEDELFVSELLALSVSVPLLPDVRVSNRLLVNVAVLRDEEEDMAFSFLFPDTALPVKGRISP